MFQTIFIGTSFCGDNCSVVVTASIIFDFHVLSGEDDYVRFGVITRRDLAKSFSIKHMRSAFLVRSLNDTLVGISIYSVYP